MNVQIFALDDPRWLQILDVIYHDIYHVPKYVAIESKRVKSPAEAIAIQEGNKILFLPYLLRSCEHLCPAHLQQRDIYDVVSPYGYSGIIFSREAIETPTFIQLALKELQQAFQSKNICSAFLRLHPILSSPFIKDIEPSIATQDGITVSVDLNQPEATIWAHTRKGHQSTINKCKRLGLQAKMVSFAENVEVFTSIYTETMNRVSANSSYYFDRDYFEDLLSLGDRLHCCIVETADQIVATSLFFECGGIVQAHLGGTRTAYMSQSPFSLLLHYVRLWAKERGNEYLHLGGGVGGSQEDRLFKFKSGFSRQQHDFYTLRLIINPNTYSELLKHRALTVNLPLEQLQQSTFFPAYRTAS